MKIEADTLNAELPEVIERVTEHVFGLINRWDYYTLVYVYNAILQEIAESYADRDPEYEHSGSIHISMSRVYTQTSYESLREFAVFFEFIRNSLRNELLDIKKREEQQNLMKSEVFWREFIEKAKSEKKAEPQLWDFKKTLSMWHVKKADDKVKCELKFCETLASLANARGGVLIIGVSDKPPREVSSIGNNLAQIEARLKHTRTVIEDYVKYDRDIVYFKQVSLRDESNNGEICLVIVIAQTEHVVEVEDKQGRFTYPIRRATGLDRISRGELAIKKLHIQSDNYDFIEELNQFVYDK